MQKSKRKKSLRRRTIGAKEVAHVSQHVERPVHEKIDRLAHALARPSGNFDIPPPANYVFWVGAGFSKTAGIPLAEGVVDRLLDKRWRPGLDGAAKLEAFCRLSSEGQRDRRVKIREWAEQQKLFGEEHINDWAGRYGQCLHLLPGEVDRQEFIIECIEEGRGRLNMAHLLLGQLIKNGFVNTVLTTNFDDLVLRTLQLYFVVPSALDPDSTNTLLTNSRFVQVAYLHGRLASYRQRHTPTEVRDAIPGFENYLAQGLQDHGLVVIGYSGGNETPMHLLHKVLMERKTGPGRGLFWVTRTTKEEHLPLKVREILTLKDCYWLSGWDADQFMKRLCAWPGIGLGIPNPLEWTKGMEQMLPDEAQRLLADSINKGSTEVTKVAAPEGSERREPFDADWYKKARELIRLDRFEEAIAVLRAVRAETEKTFFGIRLWFGPLAQTNRLDELVAVGQKAASKFESDPAAHEFAGDCFAYVGRREEAIAEYKLALEKGAHPYVNRWLGSQLNTLGRADEALPILEKALESARNASERADALGWIAKTLHDLGRHADASERFSEAEKIEPLTSTGYTTWSRSLKAIGREREANEKLERAKELSVPK